MNKAFLILAIAASLSACDARTSKPSHGTAANAVANFRYVRDPRTDLCYAVMDSSHFGSATDTSMTVTWVPCDPKVLAEIGK